MGLNLRQPGIRNQKRGILLLLSDLLAALCHLARGNPEAGSDFLQFFSWVHCIPHCLQKLLNTPEYELKISLTFSTNAASSIFNPHAQNKKKGRQKAAWETPVV